MGRFSIDRFVKDWEKLLYTAVATQRILLPASHAP